MLCLRVLLLLCLSSLRCFSISILGFSIFFFFFLMIRRPPRSTLFPTRRSSDLFPTPGLGRRQSLELPSDPEMVGRQDRKSTRLNSSHQIISYAVFCLKKKKKQT